MKEIDRQITYKGHVLEISFRCGNYIGTIQKSSNKVASFCGKDKEQVVKDFERYVDKLEKITKIYTQLTGKRLV